MPCGLANVPMFWRYLLPLCLGPRNKPQGLKKQKYSRERGVELGVMGQLEMVAIKGGGRAVL